MGRLGQGLRSALAVVAVAGGLLKLVAAQDCYANSTINGYTFDVDNFYSQDQLDDFAQNCTTLFGDVGFGSNFTGSAVLRNLQNITGLVTVGSNLTSIEFPDLLSLGGLDASSSLLRVVSLPLLERVNDIDVEEAQSLNFSSPNVLNASSIKLTGQISALDFSHLDTVFSELYIDGSSLKKSFNVSLPALRNASDVEISGNLSSLSLPLLATAGSSSQQAGLTLYNSGKPINMSLPSLSNVNGTLSLDGGIAGIYLPSLLNTTADLVVDTSSSLAVYLPSLIGANKISLEGAISSANFSSLEYFTSFDIQSNIYIDCATSLPSNRTHQGETSCSGAAKPTNNSGRAISIGVGVGVGVGGGIGLIIIVIWVYRRNLKHKKRASEAVANLDVYGLQEQTHSAAVAVERPNTDPPPYSRY
ncbi:hypothetical protein BO70DRAFT_361203 [Aspergillus heteromorphus CBS 117.55]|uniref:GPI-anchored cell wall organization protein Ecm33 n=1 Tax=Aspergillus heteromorphus CBS 117.55 TaxID=1448321 RepID=A0A317WEJ0_9EURO|nr:uncharacterized protein BO70DRAFT_361203 [Aspergillus heteromorphus CBS 117.55]PWY84803.1 hypothetical protein BO70DRAFT_361203 [Aspergillus heteromorphus CBS 117.55]